jgi:hypothetical protein
MDITCAWCNTQLDRFSNQIVCSDGCQSILRKSMRLRTPTKIHKFERRYKFERDRKALESLESVQASEYRMGLNDLYSPKRLIIRRQDAKTVVKGRE